MKISTQLRAIYDDRKPFYDRLKAEVDNRINGIRDPAWHYISRVKQEESFALKVETGRVKDPHEMEDFFGAMLVVPDLLAVEAAESLMLEHFVIEYRRPKLANRTHKAPDAFPFDDLRLYMKVKPDPRLAESPFLNTIFELQIKTFLQHAWSIATHDLIYKSDDYNWAKQRIAYQIKAMLEHAEVSIAEAKILAESPAIAKINGDSERLVATIDIIKELWAGNLPKDILRLGRIFDDICVNVGVSTDLVCQEIKRRILGGVLTVPLNKSPYTFFLEQISHIYPAKMKAYLCRPNKGADRHQVFIPPDAELAFSISRSDLKRGILIGGN